ncbi:MAG: astroprincin family protein [Leptospirales bacterium]
MNNGSSNNRLVYYAGKKIGLAIGLTAALVFTQTACETGSGTMRVKVINYAGSSIRDAEISVGSHSLKTDYSGLAEVDEIPSGTYVARIKAKGFAPGFKTVTISDGGNYYLEVMLTHLRTRKLTQLNKPVKIQDDDIVLNIAANTFKDEDGKPYKNVTLEYAPIDVTSNKLAAMPGNFQGTVKQIGKENSKSSPVDLESEGAVYVRFTHEGKELQPTQPVTLLLPFKGKIKKNKTVPLWSFNEKTGLWVEEGAGILKVYNKKQWISAKFTHFSWWNYDRPITEKTSIWIKSFSDKHGVPISIDVVTGRGISYNGISSSVFPEHRINKEGPGKCIDVKIGSKVFVRVKSLNNGVYYNSELKVDAKNISTSCDTEPEKGIVIERMIVARAPTSCVKGTINITGAGYAILESRIISWKPDTAVVLASAPAEPASRFCFDHIPLGLDMQLRVLDTRNEIVPFDSINQYVFTEDGSCTAYAAFSMYIPEKNSGNCTHNIEACTELGEFVGELKCY